MTGSNFSRLSLPLNKGFWGSVRYNFKQGLYQATETRGDYQMRITLSERLRHLPPVHHGRLDRAFATAVEKFGEDRIINLTIGSPDQYPEAEVINTLARVSADPGKHGYVVPAYGSRKLLRAAAAFRKRVNGISLDWAKQVCSLHGSRKGLFATVAALTDPKDLVMMPGMFYPGQRNSIINAYCRPVYYSVLPRTNPMEEMTRAYQQAKLDYGKFPRVCMIAPVGNPYGKALPKEFFQELIRFADENSLVIVSDEAYIYNVFSSRQAFSLMQFEGGADVGVAIYTMSKIANVPSFRAAFAEGNATIIEALKQVASSMEYGLSWAVQDAVMEALKPEHDGFSARNTALYERRCQVVQEVCAENGIEVWDADGGMFACVVLPEPWMPVRSREATARILENTGVRVNAGRNHGQEADGILRVALVQDEAVMREGCRRICEFLLNPPAQVDVPESATYDV